MSRTTSGGNHGDKRIRRGQKNRYTVARKRKEEAIAKTE